MAQDLMSQIERTPSSAYFVHRLSEPLLKMTYGELREKIEEYVAKLVLLNSQDQAKMGNPVVLVFPEKSAEFYAFSIACLVAGIAPVMLNPRVPLELLSKQMTTARSHFAATHYACFSSCQGGDAVGLKAEELGFRRFDRPAVIGEMRKRSSRDRAGDELAWIYFTSGTTGPAKPVAISWQAAQSFLDNLLAQNPLRTGTRVSQIFSPWFDPYFADVLGAVLQGATLVPIFEDEAPNLTKLIADEGISHLSATPSFVRLALLRANAAVGSCASLLQTIFTGEALTWDLVEAWRDIAPRTSVHNFYGPTETTVWIANFEVPADAFDRQLEGVVPIGKVFPNHETKILPNGELLIRGPQVCVLSEDVRGGYYHTGDQVHVDKNGDLIWAGRLNATYKVRGQRVDLLNLESKFASAAGVAVTLSVDEFGLQLSLFAHRPLSSSELEKGLVALRRVLPASLLPKQFYVLSGLGMDANGKRIRNTERLLSSAKSQHFNSESAEFVLIGEEFKVPKNLLEADHPTFFYSETAILANLKKLRNVLTHSEVSNEILFSVKSNPNSDLLRALAPEVDGFDVSSFGEHQLVRHSCGNVRLTASGPAKTKRWLNIIGDVDVVHIDSFEELEEVLALKDPPGKVALRMAVKGFGLAKLGFDGGGLNRAVERLRQHADKRPSLIGLHFYLGRESFDLAKFEEALSLSQDVFARHRDAFAETRLFIGAGFPSVHILDPGLENGLWLEKAIERTRRHGTKLQITWEAGRSIVHSAGVYVVSVIAVKERSGRRFVIVNGGLQHLASNLTSPVYANRGHRIRLWRPGQGWLTSESGSNEATVEVFGSLGTWNDRLFLSSKETALPEVQVGDRVVVFPAGAYGPTAASSEFLGLESALECFVESSGAIRQTTVEGRYISVPSEGPDGA